MILSLAHVLPHAIELFPGSMIGRKKQQYWVLNQFFGGSSTTVIFYMLLELSLHLLLDFELAHTMAVIQCLIIGKQCFGLELLLGGSSTAAPPIIGSYNYSIPRFNHWARAVF